VSEISERLKVAIAERYVIEHELGQGGMATVYLAHDVKHEREVALKVLRPELAAVIGAERFLAEIKVTANLQHPHILPLHDSGEADGFLYYVMPFVDGETLRATLDREKQLGIDDAVDLIENIAAALDYAHRKGVIHRDIKPENILVHDGQPLIADFGIALALSHAGGTRLTETGLSIGTPHYMSPEQAMGDRELDARSDVYSLGVMLYEMLAGDPPYTGSTAQAIVAKVITEKAPSVSVHRDTVPPHVAAAVSKALAKLPADRFPSTAAFAAALRNPSYTVSETAATPSDVAGSASARVWRRAALGAGTIAVVASALVGWSLVRSGATPPRVVRVSVNLPEDEARRGSPWNPTATIAPDGSRLAYQGIAESGIQQLWLRPLDALNGTPIPGTNGGYAPAFAPDGRSLAFMVGSGISTLRVVSLTGQPPVTLTDSARWFDPSWGEDGWVYFTNPAYGLSRVPAIGGPIELVTVPDTTRRERIHHWPQVLPGARGVLFTVGHTPMTDTEEYDIAVLDLETRTWSSLVRGTFARYADSGHLVFTRADGTLMAAPFDLGDMALTGPAVPLMDGMAVKNYGASDFALSRSGDLIYVTARGGQGGDRLVWVDRDGREELIDPEWQGTFGPPALSPNGADLAVSILDDGEQLWIKRLPTGPLSKLTFEGTQSYRPAWQPDGRTVAYIVEQGQGYAAFEKRADGSSVGRLLVSRPRGVEEIEWSRDGQWLIFRDGGDNGQRDILAVRANGDSTPLPLLTSPFEEYGPALSPDGRWLAYVSEESGQPEVYVRPFPNTNAARWQVSTGGGVQPLWAHSGDELFYRAGSGDVVAVQVTRQPTFALGERQVLFAGANYLVETPYHRHYDITPDDQRFVMVRSSVKATGEMVLALGWVDEMVKKISQ